MQRIVLITAIALMSSTPGWSIEVTWETHGPETRYGVTALAIAQGSPQVLYAGADLGGLFKSTDGGVSWSTLWAPTPDGSVSNHVSGIEIDPHRPEVVYVAVDNYVGSWQPGGVYKSMDGGITWTSANEGLPAPDAYFLAVDPQQSGVLYAGVSGILFKSLDYGDSWQGILDRVPVGVMAIDPHDSQTLYAGSRELFKSTDGGGSWVSISSGLLPDQVTISSLAIDPGNAHILYAGGIPSVGLDSPGRIFKSVDGGMKWIEVAQVGTWLRTLVIDPSDSGVTH